MATEISVVSRFTPDLIDHLEPISTAIIERFGSGMSPAVQNQFREIIENQLALLSEEAEARTAALDLIEKGITSEELKLTKQVAKELLQAMQMAEFYLSATVFKPIRNLAPKESLGGITAAKPGEQRAAIVRRIHTNLSNAFSGALKLGEIPDSTAKEPLTGSIETQASIYFQELSRVIHIIKSSFIQRRDIFIHLFNNDLFQETLEMLELIEEAEKDNGPEVPLASYGVLAQRLHTLIFTLKAAIVAFAVSTSATTTDIKQQVGTAASQQLQLPSRIK